MRIYTQSTIELLDDIINDLEGSRKDGFFRIYKENDSYVRNIITKEDIEEDLKKFKGLLAWCKENCSILPCIEALNVNSIKKEEWDKLLGNSFVDSILTAKENGYLFLAEEANLRGLAFSEHEVIGISIFLFINFLREFQLIEKNEIEDLIIGLISLNYKDIPIDGHILIKAAKISNYSLRPPFIWAVNGVCSEYLNSNKSIIIAVDFFYLLYLDSSIGIYASSIDFARQNLILAVLNTLRANYNLNAIKSLLLLCISKKFKLLQPQKDILFSIVNDFFKENFLYR